LDQRFHSGFSTRQRAGLDYLEEGFHDVSSLCASTYRDQANERLKLYEQNKPYREK
jgi:hypothetical protein